MSDLMLIRDSYGDSETLGKLYDADGNALAHTIERPWIKGPDFGGLSNESCVPDGIYQLVPYTRNKDGSKVVALINIKLGVYFAKKDRPEPKGRFKCLIHAGNYLEDIIGCIAPGAGRTIHKNRRMVTSSRATMQRLDVQQYTRLIIESTTGANDG
jgi:hypothetical protein